MRISTNQVSSVIERMRAYKAAQIPRSETKRYLNFQNFQKRGSVVKNE
jgi:hypothetical protein